MLLKKIKYENQQEGNDGPGSLTRVIFPTNEFYIFVPLVQTCDPRGGASFDPKGHHVNKIDKGLQKMLHTKNLSCISSIFREEEF